LRFDAVAKQAGHVPGIGRRRDRDDGAHLRHRCGRCQHGRAAEAVADQECGRAARGSQVIRRRNEISDVRGEMRIGEIAFARAEPGEIEAQHRDAARGERLGNAPGCEAALPQVKQWANSA
jgi:hypothetical protein